MTTVGQWVAWLCIRWHRTRPLENMVGDFDEDIGDDQVRSRHKTTTRCVCVPRDGGACKGGLSRCSRRAYAHGASLAEMERSTQLLRGCVAGRCWLYRRRGRRMTDRFIAGGQRP